MDVTQEILRNTEIYGSSDYTAPHSLASAKALNYANGASIQDGCRTLRPKERMLQQSSPFRFEAKT